VLTLDFTGASQRETLFGRGFGFHFRHCVGVKKVKTAAAGCLWPVRLGKSVSR
jgi:hypothetical protein